MKKLKRFLATTSAVAMCAVSAVSFNTSALLQPTYSNGTLEQVIESFGDEAVVETFGKYEKNALVITDNNEKYLFTERSNGVTITVKDGTTLPVDEIKEKISSYVSEDALDYVLRYKGETKYSLGSTKEEIYDILKSYEQVQSIDAEYSVTKARDSGLFSCEGIKIKTELDDEEIINMFPELALTNEENENHPSPVLEEGYKYFEISYESDVDLYHGFKKLQESNIEYSISILEASSMQEEYQSGIVNIYTAKTLNGDANCDGKLTIADAAAIVQFIGNPDEYPLSEQGKINADCYNTGDGVTGKDAAAIQMIEAGLIESLDKIENI